MDVRLIPNSRRPGVGLKPRRESQRPLLPQHARHCPVLEAGSALGFLVYPPLEPNESFHVGYQGEGKYRFVYYVNPTGAKWEAAFAVTVSLPAGGSGMFREEVSFMTAVPSTTKENALLMARAFFVPEDLGTPAGAFTLRGAWNFQTPTGWDAVYTPIFNAIERPVAPMMVVRVETDWYAHESEFRYILQQGEGMSCSRTLPIGQVFFVPREPITLRDATDEELTAYRQAQNEFSRDKAAVKLTTNYGLQYSPHYARKSRSMNSPASPHAQEAQERPVRDLPQSELPRPPILQKTEMPGTAAATAAAADAQGGAAARPATRIPKVGRNEPCPCGSGKKYKWCHGEG